MSTTSALEKRRSDWLNVVKRITEQCFERESRLSDLCPQRYTPSVDELRIPALRDIAKVSEQISINVVRLNDLEQDADFGFSVLLGRKPSELESIVLCLLIAARVESAVSHHIRAVGDVVYQGSCRRPDVSLAIRCLFRSDGSIHSLVCLGRSPVLDQCSVVLTEASVNRCLGLGEDQTQKLCQAEALVGRIR